MTADINPADGRSANYASTYSTTDTTGQSLSGSKGETARMRRLRAPARGVAVAGLGDHHYLSVCRAANAAPQSSPASALHLGRQLRIQASTYAGPKRAGALG